MRPEAFLEEPASEPGRVVLLARYRQREKVSAQRRRRRPVLRVYIYIYIDVCVRDANNIERRTRPNVPWERTMPLAIAGNAIALARTLRRIPGLFLV